MSQRQVAIALVVVAAVLVVYGALNFNIDVGNKKALLSVALAGGATTLAAWLWGRTAARA